MRWIPGAIGALLLVALVAYPLKADQKSKEAKEAEKTFEAAQEASKSEPAKPTVGEPQGEEQPSGSEADKSPMEYWKDVEKKLLGKNPPPRKSPEPTPGSDLRQIRQPFR